MQYMRKCRKIDKRNTMYYFMEVIMKSFKQYTQTPPQTPPSAQGAGQPPEGGERTTAEQLTRKIARAYDGKSNASMLKSILEEAEKSKRAGTLSNEEIENFYQSFAPMLDGTQKKRLRAVVERLKSI